MTHHDVLIVYLTRIWASITAHYLHYITLHTGPWSIASFNAAGRGANADSTKWRLHRRLRKCAYSCRSWATAAALHHTLRFPFHYNPPRICLGIIRLSLAHLQVAIHHSAAPEAAPNPPQPHLKLCDRPTAPVPHAQAAAHLPARVPVRALVQAPGLHRVPDTWAPRRLVYFSRP
ncbi:hypothetical protein J3F84DRAFT_356175 [Trichoderma pleuroticola]